MPNTYQTLGSLFTAIANAIRGKTGGSASIKADDFPTAIGAIPTGVDPSGATALAGDILYPKKAVLADGQLTEGTIQSQAAQTIYPSTSDQTIPAGKYLSGAQTVKAVVVSNTLIAANVAQGVTVTIGDADDPDRIMEVVGTHQGGGGGSDLDDFCQGTLTALVLASATSIRNYASENNTTLQSVSAAEATNVGQYSFIGCSALTSVSFPKATEIKTYAFYNLGNLASVSIPLCTTLGMYAFSGCQKGVLASALKATTVSGHAMENFGKTAQSGFAWEPASNAGAYDYGFAGSRITSINGKVTYIGNYAFQNAEWLESYNNTATLSTLSQYAFQNAGKSRADTTVALALDMHTGTFTSVQQYTFAGLVNAVVTLPSTVTSLAANAFNGISDSIVYITRTASVPTLSATTVFSGATNYLVALPYNILYTALQQANWNAISSMVVGYAPAGTFVAGAPLPTTDSGSHDIYWSTDPAGEGWVTECPTGSPILYAHLGSKTGWWVDSSVTGATITVTGSDSTVYPFTNGRATLPRGITFSIDAAIPSGWDSEITLDGVEVQSWPVTGLTADHDYVLAGSAWDPTAGHIWGVQWVPGASTKWTRTDDAADYDDPVPYMSGSSDYGSPFDDFAPFSGMVTSEDANAGTMVKIPKFWYLLESYGTGGLSIKISDTKKTGYSVCPACADRGDGAGERDYVYVGRYHCGSTAYKSATGQTPKNDVTRANFRTNIHNLGSTVWQYDFATRFTIFLLYLVEYADWNIQNVIGYGCGNNISVGTMGYTDSMPYHTGTTLGSRTTYGLGTQYRNIEGLWDNVYDWLDGCYNNSSGLNIILNPSSFTDSSGGTSIGTPTNGWPSKFGVSSAAGIPLFLPTEASGNDHTGSCDYWLFASSYPCVYCGGNEYQYLYHGLFYFNYEVTSFKHATLGSRSMILP